MIVAHQRDDTTEPGGTGKIGVTEHITRAIDARPLAVPDAEHAIVFALAAQLRLLRAPQRGRREVLVQTGLELDVMALANGFRAPERLVEPAHRRAAIASDIARGIVAILPVALALHQRQPDDRLRAR